MAIRSARKLPRYQLVARLKRVGVRQLDIARACAVSVGYVNRVISRAPVGDTPAVRRIWAEIERALADNGAVR